MRMSGMQDLHNVEEENAILMRECAMASLSSLNLATDASTMGLDGPTIHPEMLEDQPRSIPDTASEFLSTANETPMERFQRERQAREEAAAAESSAAPIDDKPRPGEMR